MAIAYVQSGGTSSGSTPDPQTFTWTTTSGNLVCLVIVHSSAISIVSVTDNRGNTYNHLYGPNSSGAVNHFYYAANITGGSTTVSIDYSGSAWPSAVVAQEFSGIATSSPLDQSSTADFSAASTLTAGTTGTTTQADELVVGAFGWNNTFTPAAGAGFSNASVQANTNSAYMESKIVSATGTQAATASTSPFTSNGTGYTVTFKGAAPVVVSPTFRNNRNLRPHLFSPGLAR